MLVHKFLEKSAAKTPGKIALVTSKGEWTYRQMNEEAECFSLALVDRGLEKGDRVGIYLGNTKESVVSIFGALKSGGSFIMINHSTKWDKLLYILNNSKSHALVTSRRFLDD